VSSHIPGPRQIQEDAIGGAMEVLREAERLNVAVLAADQPAQAVPRKLGGCLLCALLVEVEGVHAAFRRHSTRQ